MLVNEVLDFLKSHKIRVAPYCVVSGEDELPKAARRLGYPLVMKVISEKYSHKTDVGGVVLDIWNKEMLFNTFKYFKKKFGQSDILIQKQIKKGIELYAGIKKDDTFGHLILFGLGGIYVEVFKDISARVAPISKDEFYDMVDELRIKKILSGYRGEKIDVDSIGDLVVNLAKIGVKYDIKEMDLNPIKVSGDGYYVLDARVVM